MPELMRSKLLTYLCSRRAHRKKGKERRAVFSSLSLLKVLFCHTHILRCYLYAYCFDGVHVSLSHSTIDYPGRRCPVCPIVNLSKTSSQPISIMESCRRLGALEAIEKERGHMSTREEYVLIPTEKLFISPSISSRLHKDNNSSRNCRHASSTLKEIFPPQQEGEHRSTYVYLNR